MTNTLSGTRLDLDEVHSFVLRISIDRARGGAGAPRPQFQLEHVNSRTTRQTKSVQEACVLLKRQVDSIFGAFGLEGLTDSRNEADTDGRVPDLPLGHPDETF